VRRVERRHARPLGKSCVNLRRSSRCSRVERLEVDAVMVVLAAAALGVVVEAGEVVDEAAVVETVGAVGAVYVALLESSALPPPETAIEPAFEEATVFAALLILSATEEEWFVEDRNSVAVDALAIFGVVDTEEE